MRLRLRQLIVLSAALAAGTIPSAQAQDAAIAGFIAQLDNTVRAIHARSGDNDGAIRGQCRSLTARMMEVDTMARAAMGDTWEHMTPAQRTAFRSAFEMKLSLECVRSVRNYRGERLTLAGVRPGAGGEQFATSRFALDNEPGRMLTWRVRAAGGGLRAIDVVVDGRSVVVAARDEIASVLRSNQGNVDALIEYMQR